MGRSKIAAAACSLLLVAGCSSMLGLSEGFSRAAGPAVEREARAKAIGLGLSPEAATELAAAMRESVDAGLARARAENPLDAWTPLMQNLGLIVAAALGVGGVGGGISIAHRRAFHAGDAARIATEVIARQNKNSTA